MGSIIITIPDIPDSLLIYNEDETRQILRYFWPRLSAQIDGMEVTNDVRRFAQTALIAAIDGTYAYGYIGALFGALTRRNRDIARLGQRLARNFLRHWWRHTTQRDLEDVQIYDYVRDSIAYQLSEQVRGYFRENAAQLRRGSTTVTLLSGQVRG